VTRWVLLLEYDGSGFVGWQRQARGVAVQAVLEAAAGKLAHGAPVAAVAAGRTDAGVHAAGQVVHLDLAPPYAPDRLREALNFHLRPHAVSVLRAAVVAEAFSARFDAVGRSYRYRILNRPARPALHAGQVWHVPHALDADAMHTAAQGLLGRHDFSSFRASACQARSPLRTLDRLDVRRDGDMIEILADARSFLHHQVRNMVGTLKLVGEGRWSAARVAAALAARDRAAAGPTAPPQGLCLTAVRYAADPFTPATRYDHIAVTENPLHAPQ
jgi:tRNA pseudouridine38-40 synthase